MFPDVSVFTIGVYGRTASQFFGTLEQAGIDNFCDIRRRRAVRGPAYSFVNSVRLQAELAAMHVAYRHELDLAPTTAIRAVQKQVDQQQQVLKRSRDTLSAQFTELYFQQIESFDFGSLFSSLTGTRRLAFFCVESVASACHRSLVAAQIARQFGLTAVHL